MTQGKTLPILGSPPPADTVAIAVPVGYSVIVAREPSEDRTIIQVTVDPSQTVVINGDVQPAQRD